MQLFIYKQNNHLQFSPIATKRLERDTEREEKKQCLTKKKENLPSLHPADKFTGAYTLPQSGIWSASLHRKELLLREGC